MKNYTLYVLIIILFLSIMCNPQAQELEERIDGKQAATGEELMLAAIEDSDFNIEGFNINASSFIADSFLSMEELEEKLKELTEALAIKGKIKTMDMEDIYNYGYENYFEDLSSLDKDTILLQKTQEEGLNQIIVFSPDDQGNMTVLKFLSSQIEEEKETHIIIDIVKNKVYKDIVSISKECREILGKFSDQVDITVNFTAAHIGKLSKNQEKENLEKIFASLDASKLEVLEDEFFTSITAYSPYISNYIQYNGNKVNLQVAIRYNEYENKTYLWLANPLITSTY